MAAQSTNQKAQSPPPPQLRHRPLARAATLADVSTGPTLKHRRSSLFSDNSISESRRSFRSSVTDDLYPRANGGPHLNGHQDTSPWNSVPLGLALLPAVGGLLFKDGSAIVTDITLLALAAIFLNWSVRLPWEWYASSQAIQENGLAGAASIEAIAEESSSEDGPDNIRPIITDSSKGNNHRQAPKMEKVDSATKQSAQKELRLYELVALATCFIGPMVGAWLLHAIRSQLSRPSEGLVSNYNLTVFLLAAEIRPMSHLIKLIQERTLHLQRVVMTESLEADAKDHGTSMSDLIRNLRDLEQKVADTMDSTTRKSTEEAMAAKTTSQATSEVRKGIQPELDALNRAMRRYEKRSTLTTIQTDARLQDLESRLKDAIVLAAAAQREVDRRRNSFLNVVYSNLIALLSLPSHAFWALVRAPVDIASWIMSTGGSILLKDKPTQRKPVKRSGDSRQRERDRDRKGKANALIAG